MLVHLRDPGDPNSRLSDPPQELFQQLDLLGGRVCRDEEQRKALGFERPVETLGKLRDRQGVTPRISVLTVHLGVEREVVDEVVPAQVDRREFLARVARDEALGGQHDRWGWLEEGAVAPV